MLIKIVLYFSNLWIEKSALEDLIGGEVVITEVRVEQTDDGSVDTTGWV